MQVSGESIGDSSDILVRRMSATDVPSACSILKGSPEASSWSKESLLEWASKGIAWSADLNGTVAGVLIGRVAADEFEILNLAVDKADRRQGIATKLIRVAVEFAQMDGARRTYLEVRSSNVAGLALYARMGFQMCGRRVNYYGNPPEDAVLLVLHRIETDS
jgi:ribosomal-protein-alanine N-acetyltransferase